MARKKTTSTSKRSSSTRTKTEKTAPEQAAVRGVDAEAPPRRRAVRKRKVADAPAVETAAPVAAAAPAEELVRVERKENAVVLRFPPAAPPPAFLRNFNPVQLGAPAVEPARVSEPPPRAAVALEEPAAVREIDDPVRRAAAQFDPDQNGVEVLESDDEPADLIETDDETDEAAVDEAIDAALDDGDIDLDDQDLGLDDGPPSGAAGDGDTADDRRLTPSQRRRQRRRRRMERMRDGSVQPAQEDEHLTEAEPRDDLEQDGDDQEVELAPDEGATSHERAERGPVEGEDRGGRRRRRGGRRRGGRRRERDDVAGATDAEFVAGVSEPDEVTELNIGDEAAGETVDAEVEQSRLRKIQDLSVRVRREMIINVVPRDECRIALLENGRLEEIYFERASAENHVHNIYKGIVTNVEPSIQAAFVDFGLGKNGFLHISDLHPQYFPSGERQSETVGRKLPRRNRPPIQKCLRRGQEVLVQITKEGIGTKGPTLTTYLSIPGRFLVMMPGMRKLGVSRKIENDDVRDKLREAMAELDLPEDMGFIARTAAQGRTIRELQNDLNYLSRLWKAVDKRIKTERAPAELYRESDLVIRTIRDVFTSDVDRLVVDDPEVAERAREFLSIFSPRSRDLVVTYEHPTPIFHKYGVETELERLHSRHVPLRSGGSLVIDQTEALVAIDVNSGRFREEDDAETTAYKINCEAADEIPRQLRLRDLGGVIICDFIDMREEQHRREIERRLITNLRQHKERAKVLRMSAFGIIELTRQRQRASLTRSVYQDCHHCRGTGLVKTAESVALDVMRLLQLAATQEHISAIEVSVSGEVANLLQNRKRSALYALESKHRRTISIRPETHYGLDQAQIQCFDARGRLVPHT